MCYKKFFGSVTKDFYRSQNVVLRSEDIKLSDALAANLLLTNASLLPYFPNSGQRVLFNLQNKQFSSTIMLSLLALAVVGCGGGGGSIIEGPDGSGSFTKTGRVIKGPLENALVGLDYNGDGVGEAVALDFEKTEQQLIAVVTSYANAAEVSGATEADAFQAILNSVVDIIISKTSKLTDASATDAEKILDLTSTTDLSLLKDVFAEIDASELNVDMSGLDVVITDTVAAMKNVNNKIATVSELDSDTARDTFSRANILAANVIERQGCLDWFSHEKLLLRA